MHQWGFFSISLRANGMQRSALHATAGCWPRTHTHCHCLDLCTCCITAASRAENDCAHASTSRSVSLQAPLNLSGLLAVQNAETVQAANGTTAGWAITSGFTVSSSSSAHRSQTPVCTGPAGRAQSAKGVREKDTAGRGRGRGKGSGARSQNQKGRESSRGKGKGSWAF
jgi:hypothetical protein